MKWSQEEIDFLLEWIELPTREIYINFCEQFGLRHRTYNSVQKKAQVLKLTYGEDESPLLGQQEETSFLEQESPDIQKYINPEVEEWVKSLQSIPLRYKKTEVLSKKYSNQKENGTSLCIVFSDTHFGKKTKWFDMEEAHKRMTSVPSEIKKSNLPEVDEVVLLLIGDIVEGENIYLTQNNHIECPVIDQVKGAVKALWETILTFRELYDVPVRIETSPGNHGRVSKMAHEKSNWDNIVYYTLSVIAAQYNDPNIIMNCNYETFNTFKVKNKNVMINHHGVKHASTPATREKIAGWISSKQFEIIIHGHWHEWHVGNWLGRFVLGNGCMCGPDDLSEQMGKEDAARQAYFLIAEDKPIWGFSFVEWETK